MTPADILRQTFDAGVEVSIAPSGNLFVQPVERLTAELRVLLIEHKPALLAYLHEVEAMTADLIAAAMRCSDHHADSDLARAQMRADIEATPPHLRADLLEHFRQAYPRRGA